MPGIPKHKFLGSWSFTIGDQSFFRFQGQYSSGSVLRGDESNQLSKTDSYFKLDIIYRVQVSKNISAYLKAANVLDRNYENFGIVGEDPSRLLPNLNPKSSIFLSPGEPRGVWLGFNLKY